MIFFSLWTRSSIIKCIPSDEESGLVEAPRSNQVWTALFKTQKTTKLACLFSVFKGKKGWYAIWELLDQYCMTITNTHQSIKQEHTQQMTQTKYIKGNLCEKGTRWRWNKKEKEAPIPKRSNRQNIFIVHLFNTKKLKKIKCMVLFSIHLFTAVSRSNRATTYEIMHLF
jgi:hypothetical protein